MIQVSKQVDYAVTFLLDLAKLPAGSTRSLRQFATERNLSFLFLQKIAQKLRAHDLIGAVQGPTGGYFLKQGADQISLHDVILSVEGRTTSLSCQKKAGCHMEAACTVKTVWGKVDQEIQEVLGKYSLQDLHSFFPTSSS